MSVAVDIPATLAELVPENRALTQGELLTVAHATPEHIDIEAYVEHMDGARVCRQLFATEHYEAWLIAWQNDGDTGWHDHDISMGAVSVVRGELREENICLRSSDSWSAEKAFVAGAGFTFDERHIHRMTHAGGGPAVSIHCYSPPLVRMGAYELDEDGILRRETISGDQELIASSGF